MYMLLLFLIFFLLNSVFTQIGFLDLFLVLIFFFFNNLLMCEWREHLYQGLHLQEATHRNSSVLLPWVGSGDQVRVLEHGCQLVFCVLWVLYVGTGKEFKVRKGLLLNSASQLVCHSLSGRTILELWDLMV